MNAIILPLSGWTLYTVHALAKAIAIEAVYGQGHDKEILDLRARVSQVEADIMHLKIEFAQLKHHA